MMNQRLRALALLLIAGIACSACTATAAQRPATDEAGAQAALRTLPVAVSRIVKGRVVNVDRARPRFTIPFVRPAETERIAVLHEISADARQQPIAMRSLFSETGSFIGAQSLTTMPDPRRMTVDVLETGLTRMGVALTLPLTAQEPDLDAVWKAIAQRVPLDEIREFNLYRVDYVVRGVRRPAVIVNIWGPRNPLGMRDELPDVVKNRIRFIYYLDDGTWAADNLL